MDRQQMARQLKAETFEPFALVTREGHRYEIRDRTLLKLLADGRMHVLFPTTDDAAHFDGWTTVKCHDVVSLEPLRKAAS
jgi:hypothetical protein